MTALWLLWPALALNGCAHAAPRPDIPASLLEYPIPAPYPDPTTASQSDLIAALIDTYFAYEATAADLDNIKIILNKKDQ